MQAAAKASKEETAPEFIDVVFKRNAQGEIKGVVTRDCKSIPMTLRDHYTMHKDDPVYHDDDFYENPGKTPRRKIVFVFGYRPEKLENWQGALPKDGEEWTCEVIKDTTPEDPWRGALVVKLVTNLTAFKEAQRRKEEERLSIIMRQKNDPMEEYSITLEKAQAIEKFALAFAEKRGLNMAVKTLEVFWGYPASIYDFGNVPTHHRQEVAEIVRMARDICVHYKILTYSARLWLEHLLKTGVGETTFAYHGKRNVNCHSCGGIMKFSKEEKNKFARGEEILLVCEHCAKKGPVNK